MREHLVAGLTGVSWRVAYSNEMRLGSGLVPASGVLHEVDLVCLHASCTVVYELKNYGQSQVGKNDVITFYAKLLDFLCGNPALLDREFSAVFVSASGFDDAGLAACVGLGIHPLGPRIRPLPLLAQTASILGARAPEPLLARADDLCAVVNALAVDASQTFFDARFGAHGDSSVFVRRLPDLDAYALADRLRAANDECSRLLVAATEAATGAAPVGSDA